MSIICSTVLSYDISSQSLLLSSGLKHCSKNFLNGISLGESHYMSEESESFSFDAFLPKFAFRLIKD